ncbi:MAG: GDYXXLXY domain-containing protein [Helicobacteraceae bacterium]|jgi:uncharacterized membrane-anchored protein|nr:GDYXXLXY domain-containing protein [Helicobacteraceae bacterium]
MRAFLERNRVKIVLSALGVCLAAQAFACVYQIVRYESALRLGKLITLLTISYDPFDPMRGRYIRLNVGSAEFATDKQVCANRRLGEFFVTYKAEPDDRNLSVIDGVYASEPQTELAYLKVKGVCFPYDYKTVVRLDYSFDRFYMQEDQAKAVDRDPNLLTSNNDARVVIRALNGVGLVENVMIGSQTLQEYLRENKEADDDNRLF